VAGIETFPFESPCYLSRGGDCTNPSQGGKVFEG
jgi:hypothetical protein